jgi:hypothetical protein
MIDKRYFLLQPLDSPSSNVPFNDNRAPVREHHRMNDRHGITARNRMEETIKMTR